MDNLKYDMSDTDEVRKFGTKIGREGNLTIIVTGCLLEFKSEMNIGLTQHNLIVTDKKVKEVIKAKQN